MKLIIDISQKDYKEVQEDTYSGTSFENRVFSAIANSTPLPKGHGRIADMDEAIKCIKDVEGDDAIWAISLIEWACGKRTLIEADV